MKKVIFYLTLTLIFWSQIGVAQNNSSNVVSVLNYNVMMLPKWLYLDHQQFYRAEQIPSALSRTGQFWDVVVFNEAFWADSRTKLLQGMFITGYFFSSEVVGNKGGGVSSNGGVVIVSRWPILEQEEIIYSTCVGSDCLANKGAMYVKINKGGRICHIFGTHLQSDSGLIESLVRKAQLQALAAFIKKKTEGAGTRGEPVIISGDFNIDYHTEKADINTALNVLDAEFTTDLPVDHSFDAVIKAAETFKQAGIKFTFTLPLSYTFHTGANTWASWRYKSAKPEWLDYILDCKAGAKPLHKTFEVIPFKVPDGKEDLSDHYALSATYIF